MSSKLLNLLLADDDFDDRYFFKEALETLPFSISLIAAEDGEQLLRLLARETSELPDAIFLDLNMPRKNGFECLLEIKLNEKLNQIPVIIFSTSYEHNVVNLLYKNGAKYFIRKPPDVSQLGRVIQQALTLIANETFPQPSREDFVLTGQTKICANKSA
jgi:CheY-like chemotaxis protein